MRRARIWSDACPNTLSGFSLLELLLALTITIGIGMVGFQLFWQNERAFRDQNLIMEMQQTARGVLDQISDEIRMAGEGVPLYASTFDLVNYEEVTSVLNGSDSTHLRIRAGLSNAETTVTTVPADYVANTSRTISVGNATLFPSPSAGHFIYIWGSGAGGCGGWIRAELTALNTNANQMTVTPRQLGEACHTFTSAQTVTQEEVMSIYLNSGSIWHTTASDMTNETSPAWNAASELGRSFVSLAFTYYDKDGAPLTPNTLAARIAVARIDIKAVVQTSIPLSTGVKATYALGVRSLLRNGRIR